MQPCNFKHKPRSQVPSIFSHPKVPNDTFTFKVLAQRCVLQCLHTSSEGKLKLLKSSFVLKQKEGAKEAFYTGLFILKEMQSAFFTTQTLEG